MDLEDYPKWECKTLADCFIKMPYDVCYVNPVWLAKNAFCEELNDSLCHYDCIYYSEIANAFFIIHDNEYPYRYTKLRKTFGEGK